MARWVFRFKVAVLTAIREKLFISYASEDATFARWLTLKLTAEGYNVWCAEFQLLGGESFPGDVGKAIETESFRVLGLLSRFSLRKPNPQKERTIALDIGQKRKQEFLIPLLLDDVPTEWMTSDLVKVNFAENWAFGLDQLLKKLDKIETPRSNSEGIETAASTFLQRSFVLPIPERLYSNILRVKCIPKVLKKFRLSRLLKSHEKVSLLDNWPAYATEDERTFRSFQSPSEDVVESCEITELGKGSLWSAMPRIDNIWTPNIISNLLKRSLRCKCVDLGLVWTREHDYLYFPDGFAENNKIKFTDYSGRKTWLTAVGEQSFPGSDKFRYHLAPTFQVRQDFDDDFVIRLRNRVFLSDLNDRPLDTSQSLTRRKRVCKSWWNDDWIKRQIAVLEFLSDGEGFIRMGDSEEQLVVHSQPVSFEVPTSLDDAAIREFNQGVDLSDIDGDFDVEMSEADDE